MACCPKGNTEVSAVVKYVLLFGTFLHWLSGAAIMGIGIWAFVEKNKYYYQPVRDIYDLLSDVSICMIILGGIMFVITMCGFVGALRENICLLRIFYISLMVIFVLEIVAAVLAFVFKDDAKEFISGVLEDIYIIRYQDDEEAVIDHFQEKYDCCGIRSYEDWNKNMYFNCTETNPSQLKCAVPYSCCRKPDDVTPGLINVLCGADALTATSVTLGKIWTTGCVEALIVLAEKNMPLVGGIIIAIAVPQIIGIMLGRTLAGQIEDQWQIYHNEQRRRERQFRY